MGFFTNTGALKEGEIVLSSDHRHLYLIVEGKPVEFEKYAYHQVIRSYGYPVKSKEYRYTTCQKELRTYII